MSRAHTGLIQLNLRGLSIDQGKRASAEGGWNVDHAAIDCRRLFRRIHAQVARARAGDDRAWTRAFAVRDFEGPRHAALGAFYRAVLLRLHREENFTVTEPNDIIFFDYFYQRCVAEDEDLQAEQELRKPRPGLIRRIFSWMAQPI